MVLLRQRFGIDDVDGALQAAGEDFLEGSGVHHGALANVHYQGAIRRAARNSSPTSSWVCKVRHPNLTCVSLLACRSSGN